MTHSGHGRWQKPQPSREGVDWLAQFAQGVLDNDGSALQRQGGARVGPVSSSLANAPCISALSGEET